MSAEEGRSEKSREEGEEQIDLLDLSSSRLSVSNEYSDSSHSS